MEGNHLNRFTPTLPLTKYAVDKFIEFYINATIIETKLSLQNVVSMVILYIFIFCLSRCLCGLKCFF